MLTCPSCGQENPDVAKFCLACGTALAAPEPLLEERKLVTVLFTDIVGSTARAEQLDPEDVRARLRPYYERVSAELVRHGGTVEKFIGDAVVALFGAPVAHEDDPERAVRAAFAVRDAVMELNREDEWLDLHLRTAVHTGEALIVTGARPEQGEGMAAGDVMNTAARLQSAAPPDGIVAGQLTYLETRDTVEYRETEPVAAKGKTEPVRAWEAIALLDAPRLRPGADLFVGRDAELRRLLDAWESALTRNRATLAFVLGAPGIGKSRLLSELAARCGADVHVGRCLSYGGGITYWPAMEIVKNAAGILQSDDGPAASAKLGALLESLPSDDATELRTVATAAANLLGIGASPQGSYATTEISQGELHWGVRRLLHLLGRRRPLLVVFEDLHWAESTLLELVELLGEDGEGTQLLVVGSARPELRERAPELLARHVSVALEPLPTAAGEELLAGLLGEAALARDPAALAVLERAGGNPLFLEETVRMLSESGQVDRGGWHLGGNGDALQVPTSLQGLIASRLDGLPQTEKRVAQHASVAGLVFWAGAVSHMQGGDGSVHASLAGLEQRDVVHPAPASSVAGEREYVFKHILIRDVAYGELPKGRRAELHLLFADWVESLPGPEEEFVEIVAYHLEQSCRMAREVARSPVEPPVARAAAALSRAGEKAERREGYREAERYYGRAIELLDPADTEARAELLLRYARPLAGLGRLQQVAGVAREAAELAETLGRVDLRADALVLLANLELRLEHGAEARYLLYEAIEFALRSGDHRLQVKAWYALAAGGGFAVEPQAAAERLRGAIALADELDDRALVIEGHLRLSFVLMNAGELAGAEAEFTKCLELAGSLGSRADEARALPPLAMIKYLRGDLAEAERLGLEARSALEVTGETFFQVQNEIALAQFARARGERAEAERRLRDALPTALEQGGWVLTDLYRLLVHVLAEAGSVDEAAELAEFAARDVVEDRSYTFAAILLARASVAVARGDEFVQQYEQALGLLDELGLPIDASLARIAYAEALTRAGDEERARRQLELAHAAVGPEVPAPPPFGA